MYGYPYYGGYASVYPSYGGVYTSPFPASSTAAPSATVSIAVGSYTPNPVTIAVGQTVRWTATDFAHTATSDTRLWDSGCIAPSASYAYTFTTRGTFGYYCTYHGHRGTITVT